MSGESPILRKKKQPEGRDATDLDQSRGYVSLTEIRNIRTYRTRLLDSEIWPMGRMPTRSELIEFFVTTFIQLEQRAQTNFEQFVKNNPQVHQKPKPEDQEAQKKAYEERRQKLEKWHT